MSVSQQGRREPPQTLARHILIEAPRTRRALRNSLPTEDITAPNSMKVLMATAVVGFAVLALDAAKAGPNGEKKEATHDQLHAQ